MTSPWAERVAVGPDAAVLPWVEATFRYTDIRNKRYSLSQAFSGERGFWAELLAYFGIMARDWGLAMVVGGPGSGKTTALAHLAAALGHLSRAPEAHAAVQELIHRKAEFTVAYARQHLFYLEDQRQLDEHARRDQHVQRGDAHGSRQVTRGGASEAPRPQRCRAAQRDVHRNADADDPRTPFRHRVAKPGIGHEQDAELRDADDEHHQRRRHQREFEQIGRAHV